MSQQKYKALTSFVLADHTTVRQGEIRVYNDDAVEADLLQAGYIRVFDENREVWGTTDLSYMFYQGNRSGIIADVLENVGDGPLTGLDAAFAYCYYVNALDVSALDTSEITNFNRVFMHCEALTRLDLSAWDTRSLQSSEYMLAHTKNLAALIINNSSRVLNLTNANALEGSAIAAGTGFVYVPASMVATYKADAVWGLYPNQIKSIAELPA